MTWPVYRARGHSAQMPKGDADKLHIGCTSTGQVSLTGASNRQTPAGRIADKTNKTRVAPMRFATSYDALFRPYLQDPVDPDLFTNRPEALCAELSRLAYFPFPPDASRLAAAFERHGFVDWHFFEEPHRDTRAIALVDADGTAWIAFRGTEKTSRSNILTDAAFLKRPWHIGGRVHRGFRRAYSEAGSVRWTDRDGKPGPMHDRGFSMRDCLGTWVAQHARGRLVVTGHSLGAALATLLASEHLQAELVTFGSPLVGNAEFAALFDDPARIVKRYRGCCDLVTSIPYPLIGYRHLRGLRHIDLDGVERDWHDDDRAVIEDREQARRAYRAVPKWNLTQVKLRGMADHAPINYVSALLGLRQPLAQP